MGDPRHHDRAEQIARQDPVNVEDLTNEEVRAALHELKVQRIAVELQNEELRVARNELERSRNEFRELFERAPTGYLVVDRHGIVHRANPVFALLVGRSRSELASKAFVEYLADEDRHVFLSRFRAMFDVPEGKSMVARLRVPPEDPRVVRIEISRTREFTAPDSDEEEFALMVVSDISELTRANTLLERHARALQLRTAVYAALLENPGTEGYAALVHTLVERTNAELGWLAVPLEDNELELVAEHAPKGVDLPRLVSIERCGELVRRSLEERTPRFARRFEVEPFDASCPDRIATMNRAASIPVLNRETLVAHVLLAGENLTPELEEPEMLADAAGFLSPLVANRLELAREERRRLEAEQQIASSLREKEVLLREIHHRVKNNLQVISSLLGMASDRSSHPEVASVLESSKSRVLAMALIHEALYRTDDLSSIDLSIYLENLLHSLETAICDNGRIRLERDIEPVLVDIDRGLPIGIIINELVSNAVKHAFAPDESGSVTVGLRTLGDRARLTVRDTGVGFDPEGAPDSARSLGIMLVRILANQVEATLDYRNDHGTVVELELDAGTDPSHQS